MCLGLLGVCWIEVGECFGRWDVLSAEPGVIKDCRSGEGAESLFEAR